MTKNTKVQSDTEPHSNKPHSDAPEFSTRDDRRRQIGLVVGVTAIVGVLLVVGLAPRLSGTPKPIPGAVQVSDNRPEVAVIVVRSSPPFSDVNLPGTMDAIDQTSIVARANGYVDKWMVNIGDHVVAGQTLAIISTPDLDQQLLEARSQLASEQAAYSQSLANVTGLRAKLSEARANLSRAHAAYDESQTDVSKARANVAHATDALARQQAQVVQAQTNMNLAKVTSERYNGMLKDGAIDRQSADEAQASYDADLANVQAVEASLAAARDDVQASKEAVRSAQASVEAYANGIESNEANVQSAQANIESGSANVRAAQANVSSSEANVAKMASLKSFQRVVAPYSGIITARNIDTGSLVSATGSGGGSGTGSGAAGIAVTGGAAGANGASSGGQSGLFSIAKTDRLRVYINVPQEDVNAVHVGQSAIVTVSAIGNRKVSGTIVRTADALDPVSRTLVTEVDINNSDGKLTPGMFVQVRLRIENPKGVLLIPDSALVSNARGTQAVVINSANKVQFTPIVVGRDFGKEIEITDGLKPGDVIASSPSDGLIDGEIVKPENAGAGG